MTEAPVEGALEGALMALHDHAQASAALQDEESRHRQALHGKHALEERLHVAMEAAAAKARTHPCAHYLLAGIAFSLT